MKRKNQRPVQFRCVDVDRKGQMSEPYEISFSDLNAALREGEDVRLLLKSGCTWNIGDQVRIGDDFAHLPEFTTP